MSNSQVSDAKGTNPSRDGSGLDASDDDLDLREVIKHCGLSRDEALLLAKHGCKGIAAVLTLRPDRLTPGSGLTTVEIDEIRARALARFSEDTPEIKWAKEVVRRAEVERRWWIGAGIVIILAAIPDVLSIARTMIQFPPVGRNLPAYLVSIAIWGPLLFVWLRYGLKAFVVFGVLVVATLFTLGFLHRIGVISLW